MDAIAKKEAVAKARQEDFNIRKEEIDRDLKIHIAKQEEMQKKVEDKKKDINAKIHERKLLNGDLVT